MNKKNIVAEIVEQRKKDIAVRGYSFGFEIPEKRTRTINPFMAEKGAILEVKRASPSKGLIAPDLKAAETALLYKKNGAAAISCLTEENYFKGSLKDLIEICKAVPDVAVLRKDFLIDEEEIEIAYRCGADAVLLISGILNQEKLISMTAKCRELGIRALVEVRTEEDAEKVIKAKDLFPETIVCGVNSRNLKDFTIDLLVPAMLKNKLGGQVVFESGITTEETAAKIGAMGFTGILLGEYAARNPEMANRFVKAFVEAKENAYGKKLVQLADKINSAGKPMVKICGLTRAEDVLLADQLGADFTGFIFADGFGRNVYGERFAKIEPVLNQVKAWKVAVVTDVNSKEAKEASELCKKGVLDLIQVHLMNGNENTELPSYLAEVPHYFAVASKTEIKPETMEHFFSIGEARVLQDCKTHAYGSKEHLWLAGGVTPENISQLIKEFQPELVDASSGIETEETGIKDSEKLRKFFSEIQRG